MKNYMTKNEAYQGEPMTRLNISIPRRLKVEINQYFGRSGRAGRPFGDDGPSRFFREKIEEVLIPWRAEMEAAAAQRALSRGGASREASAKRSKKSA